MPVRRAFHVLALAGLCAARPARADPQVSLGLTVGTALDDVIGPRPIGGAMHLGARGDLLLLRSAPDRQALGPYADVATSGFRNLDAGGGVSWLLPWIEDLPFVVSAGAFARNGQGRSWSPGIEGTLFAGSRSYNFHSWYGMTIGLFAQTRWVPAPPATMDVVLGLQLDAELLVIPWLFLYEAVTH